MGLVALIAFRWHVTEKIAGPEPGSTHDLLIVGFVLKRSPAALRNRARSLDRLRERNAHD